VKYLKPLKAGDPVSSGPASAGAWNELADAAQYVERLRRVGPNAAGRPLFADRTMVMVENASGYARDRFDVLGISDSILNPTDSANAFKSQMCLEGDTPATPDHYGKFVVLAQPLASNGIGWAWISGVCVVQIDFDYDDQPYADIKDADAGLLVADEGGAAQVLWKEADTGTLWAIVRLGVPHYTILRGKLDANLNAGSSAAMSIWEGDTLADSGRNVTVYDHAGMLGTGKKIASTTVVTASWTSGKWYVLTSAACEVAQ